MTEVQKLNKDFQIESKINGGSIGLKQLRHYLLDSPRERRLERWTVYFTRITNNRFMAHLIVDGELVRLRIPEAGYKFYDNYKDGYQANGGGYNKPEHILDAMLLSLAMVHGQSIMDIRQKVQTRIIS
jgi:hypothetical protein